jgi:hypothetical protein
MLHVAKLLDLAYFLAERFDVLEQLILVGRLHGACLLGSDVADGLRIV